MVSLDPREYLDKLPDSEGLSFMLSGAILGILFISIIGVLFFYFTTELSSESASVLVSAMGALSTVLLVIVTFATFAHNRTLTKKEQERPLIKEEINTVLTPIIDQVKSNIEMIREEETDWSNIKHRTGEENYTLQKTVPQKLKSAHSSDFAVYSRFFERHPDVAADVEEHDELVDELLETADVLIEALHNPIESYIYNKKVTVGRDELADPQVIISLLIQDLETVDRGYPYGYKWETHHHNFEIIAEEEASNQLSAFHDLREEYLTLAEDLETDLVNLRARLQTRFHFAIHDRSE